MWCRRGDLNPCHDTSTASTPCVCARQRPRRPPTSSTASTDSMPFVCFRDHSVTNIHRPFPVTPHGQGSSSAFAIVLSLRTSRCGSLSMATKSSRS